MPLFEGLWGEFLIILSLAFVGGAIAYAVALWLPKLMPSYREPLADSLVYFLVAVYILIFFILSILRHESFNSAAYDLGIFDQVIWNSAHGRPFRNSLMWDSPNFLGHHFSPILLLLVPLYLLWSDPRLLLMVQTVALAVSVFPIYWWAKERSQDGNIALSVAASYLLSPALAFVNLSDFHEIALATPLLSFATYYLLKRNHGSFLVFLVLVLLCKEEMALVAAASGLFLILFQKRTLSGSAIAILGTLWGFVAIQVVIPYFHRSDEYFFVCSYSYLGGSTKEILRTIISRPIYTLRHAFSPPKLTFLAHLFVPTGLLPILGLDVLLLSLPTFVYLLLRDQLSIASQYAAPIIPFISYACVEGMARLQGWSKPLRAPLKLALVVFLLLSGGLSYYVHNPGPLSKQFKSQDYAITPRVNLEKQIMAQIPPDIPVSAQDRLVPHLSGRERIYLFPDGWKTGDVQFIALDTKGSYYPLEPHSYEKDFQHLLADPTYKISVEADGYFLFQKADGLAIEHPLRAKLGGQIALLGFDLAVENESGGYIPQSLPLQIAPGQKIRLSLYWQGLAGIDTDYTVFTHVLDDEDRIIGQHDGFPGNGFRLTELWQPAVFKLTSKWRPGEVVRDVHYLSVDHHAKASRGLLEVGMYDLRTGERLPTANGEDHLILTEVIVER